MSPAHGLRSVRSHTRHLLPPPGSAQDRAAAARAIEFIADYTGEAGNPAAAWAQLAALVPVVERVLGPVTNLTCANNPTVTNYSCRERSGD
jgi:hypothetical protein